jgi:hypothetical protein
VGHGSARSKECANYKKTQQQALQEKLGFDYERYTRKIKFDTVVRPEYQPRFKNSLLRLNEFLREFIIKAQLFVNYCLIEEKNLLNHKCIY